MTFRRCIMSILLVVGAMFPVLVRGATKETPALQPGLSLESVKLAGRHAVATSTPTPDRSLEVQTAWNGNFCELMLINQGSQPVRVHEIVVASIPHNLPPSTPIWGEGFQMVTQTGGTLGEPVDLGFFADRKMYRIPQPADATTVYNVLALSPHGGKDIVMGFTSCRRFSGSFRLYPGRIDAVLDAEDLQIEAGEQWKLEELMYAEGTDRQSLLASLADRIAVHHKPLTVKEIPAGWCSWYCFAEKVTAKQLEDNLETIKTKLPQLKYFQIDDGYQAAMGDWLATRPDFGGDIGDVCRRIKATGLQPAIWVAPFIAEAKSRVFQEHPDWFVMDESGKPLPSDRVTFGGWRCGPWYALDTTNPDACKHLETVFRTMNQQWGCTYFKLDANYWGAMHGGRRHDPKATRVEAYRRGMEAILRGAGNSFILGCNHPMWPSLGLLHGARCSMDAGNDWEHRRRTSLESFHRNWEHGRLWINDPDVLMLAGDHPVEDQRFRTAVIYATGGLVMAGDDLSTLPEDRLALIRKVLPPNGTAARFNDDFTVGWMDMKDSAKKTATVVLFNWSDQPTERTVRLPHRSRITDFWTDEDLGTRDGDLQLSLPARSSRLLICSPASD